MSTVDEKIVRGGALRAALTNVKDKVANMIDANAPDVATSTKAGIVKPGTGLAVDANGVMSVTGDATVNSVAWSAVQNVPVASATAAGIAKAGTGLTAAADGTLNVDFSSAVTEAKDYADQKVSDLIGGAPAALDTLKEIADYLDNDSDTKAGLVQQIAKVDGKAQANATEIATLKAAGYTTEAALLAKYPKLSKIASTEDVTTALAPYAKTADVNTALAPYAKTAEVNTALAPYAKTTEVDAKLEEYAKSAEIDALGMTEAEARSIVESVFA